MRRKYFILLMRLPLLLIAATPFGLFDLTSTRAASGQPPQTIAPEQMTLTFEENFDMLDVSAWGPGTRWIAHTPWAGDFGGAAFADPEFRDGLPSFPFITVGGMLRIEASQDANGRWRSGLLASVDKNGDGFAQQYGYFEISAKLPTQEAVWPAFWLIGKDRSKTTAEIDILEFYGTKPSGYSSVVHVWRRPGGAYSEGNRNEVFDNASPADFHQYGAWVGEDWIGMYFDRKLVWQTPTQPEHRQPLYMLLNLALVEDRAALARTATSHMYVDYVRAYMAPAR